MFTLDCETIGLSGIAVLIQWARNDGEVHLHHVWREPVKDTLDLIKDFTTDSVVGFNLTFDSYHIHRLHSILELSSNKSSVPDAEECFHNQEKAIYAAKAIRPKAICDLLMVARRGKFQSLMRRDPIRIRRVPTVLADALAIELDKRVQLPDIFFARSKHGPRWRVFDIKDEKHFKDVVLSFNPASGLKFLAEYALGRSRPHFDEISLDMPAENDIQYAPLKSQWLDVLEHHVNHWATNTEAQFYAEADIHDTRDLYRQVFNSPEPGDVDSELAWNLGGVQWRGFAVDVEKIKGNLAYEQKILDASEVNINAPAQVRKYLTEVMEPEEAICLAESTKQQILKNIADGKLWKGHPASERARKVLRAKVAKKRIELYDKTIEAGRLHPLVNVIGTKTARMTSTGGYNYLAINKKKEVRESFPLHDENEELSGGDFDAFEMTIAQAKYQSEELKKYILGDRSIHGDFGTALFDQTYEEIIGSKGTDDDLYTLSKQGAFAKLFFGTAYTLHQNLGIEMEKAEEADEYWREMLPTIAEETDKLKRQFCTINTDNWTWSDPIEEIDNGLGFKRTFIIENLVTKALFELGMNPPKHWNKVNARVVRRKTKGLQTAANAVRSALLGAALSQQSSNMRTGGNHPVQSCGAEITKAAQCKVAHLQPVGIHPWRVRTLNYHDEILCVHNTEDRQIVKETIEAAVEQFKEMIPLLRIDWKSNLETWADK